MKIKNISTAVVFSLLANSATAAGDAACVVAEVNKLRQEKSIDFKLTHISCRAGKNDLFRGCQRQTKNYSTVHSVGDGWQIVNGTAHIDLRNGRYTERTRATISKIEGANVTVKYWCQGHGCGGQGTSFSDVFLKAKVKRGPTPVEMDAIMAKCGF